MKRKILVMIAAIAAVLILPLAVNAASVDDLTFDKTTGTITGCNQNATGELVIPEEIDGVKVISIGDNAFLDCTGLTSVTIPDRVTYIGDSAFESCGSLTSVTIPDSVTSIGYSAFSECSNLTSVNIGSNVTSIGDWAFSECTSLTGITIPDGVTSIGECMFYYCEGLTSVIIPDSVTSIGDDAFRGCGSLTNIMIPDSVTSIGLEAFSDCGSLNISVDQNNTSFCDINGVLFNKNKSEILAYSKDEIQPDYTIPGSVTRIGDYAFWGCNGLTSITIPDSVTSIGDYAFSFCTGLTNVIIPDSVTSIGEHAFEVCRNLTSVTISNSVTSIGKSVFDNCEGLTSVIIPDSVTSIGEHAFYDCRSLTNITIPDSVMSIGNEAFNFCLTLTSVTISNSLTSIGYGVFKNTAYYKNDDNWENGVLYIGNYLIEANSQELDSDYTINPGTKIIADNAFRNCTKLTSITIPDGVKSIGKYAFEGCYKLTSVTMSDSITSIRESAFSGCDSLSDVYYFGAKKKWMWFLIGSNNEPLRNATIHFMIKPLEVEPVEPVVDEEANTVEVPVTVVESERAEELKDVRLYAAEYDADGHLLNVTVWKNEEINGDTVTITADIPNAAKYKLMLWDGNNVPLMDAVDDITAIQ